ncbi:MAG: amidohydrolase, partial [Deltaproteobacteria bacterium]|nr:amidohydrolase [Deltaproteobacteria bacterium]
MTRNDTAPDLILIKGSICTLDRQKPQAEAVAVKAGRIIAVGENDAIAALTGRQTKRIALDGRLVIPGLMDSHFHFYDWAMGRKQLDLARVHSLDELLEQVAQTAASLPPQKWILGQGWNESDWPEHTMPRRDHLDAMAPAHPVALWRCDLHLVAVNSRALELAGIDQSTPDPPDGVIEKDSSGRPSGILRELAPNLVKAVLPAPSADEVVAAMRDGITHLHSLGLTGLHDVRLMGGLEGAPALKAWQFLNEENKLDLRCWVSLAGERLDEAIALGLRTGLGDDRLHIGHLKYFADGGMGARTAWMLEPYLDAEYGMPLGSVAELAKKIAAAEKAGLAVMVHAIGDRANREVIGVLEELAELRNRTKERSFIPSALPHRIEHAQMIRFEDIQRLAELKVAACVQPHNMILDINMIDESVGPLGRYTYAYKEMIDAG